MSNFKKPNFSNPESSDAKLESEKKYESGNITFFVEGAKNINQIEITKSIIKAISPYMDNKVYVRYKEIKPENPGFNATLNPEFRDENYYDSVTINSNYKHQEELLFFLAHELGHSFEEKLEQIVKDNNVDALPVGVDDEYADFYADLIAVYILKPELLKKLEDIPVGQNTLFAIQKLFDGNDFTELRAKLNLLSNQEATIELDNEEEEDKKARLDKLFKRVFDKINEYINQ